MALDYLQSAAPARDKRPGTTGQTHTFEMSRQQGQLADFEHPTKRTGLNFRFRLEEYHDRRHLLVHRSGKTDAQYRKKYGWEGRQLSVAEDYLTKCILDFTTFADGIQSHLKQWLASVSSRTSKAPELKLTFAVTHDPSEEPPILAPSFHYLVEDQVVFLRDILAQKHSGNDGHSDLTLAGAAKAVRCYAKSDLSR